MGRKRQDENRNQEWQRSGYRMGDAPCNHAIPVSDQNDTGYVEPNREEAWQGDPFADDAVDEGLREERAESLESHSSDFWDGPAKGRIERDPEHRKQTTLEKIKKKLSINQKVIVGFISAVAVALVIVAVLFVLVPRITEIRVEGLSGQRYTAEAVCEMAGIHQGDNLLTVNEAKAKEGVNANRYLVFVRLEKQWPNQVTLVVREREQFAYTEYNGIIYVMDSSAVVLEESGDLGAVPDMLRVTGFDIMRANIGERLVLRRSAQMDFYRNLCVQLKVMDLTGVVRACNLARTESIYLTTADGFSVYLGDTTQLHEKLRAMTLVLDWVRDPENGGYTGGTIEVSQPEKPSFQPT